MAGIDPVGVTLGVPGLLISLVQTFEYIQLGREFAKDYSHSRLQLRLCQNNLANWARTVGLSTDLNSTTGLTSNALFQSFDLEQKELIKETLASIETTFQEAQKASKRYEKANKGELSNLAVVELDDADNLSAALSKMTLFFGRKNKSRQQQAGLVLKTRWALYDKKKFDAFVKKVNELTTELGSTIPKRYQAEARHEQERLAKQDAAAAAGADINMMKTLTEAAEDTDDIMAQTAKNMVEAMEGAEYSEIKTEGNAQAFMGHEVAYGVRVKGNKYHNIILGGQTITQVGNRYHGPLDARQVEFSRANPCSTNVRVAGGRHVYDPADVNRYVKARLAAAGIPGHTVQRTGPVGRVDTIQTQDTSDDSN